MYQCWHGNPDERPTFSQLRTKISAALSSMADYLEFSEIAPCDEIDKVHTLSCTKWQILKGELGGWHVMYSNTLVLELEKVV